MNSTSRDRAEERTAREGQRMVLEAEARAANVARRAHLQLVHPPPSGAEREPYLRVSVDKLYKFLQGLIRHAEAQPKYSPEFHRALAGLHDHVTPERASQAVRVWHQISAVCEPPEPLIESTHEGGVRFAWSSDQTYLDLEVHEDGFEWFFRNRAAGTAEGTEDEREATVPEPFLARLTQLQR